MTPHDQYEEGSYLDLDPEDSEAPDDTPLVRATARKERGPDDLMTVGPSSAPVVAHRARQEAQLAP